MGKALKPLAIIAGIGLQFIPGVGNAVGALLLGSGAAAMGGALLGTIAVGALGAGLVVYGASGGKRGGRSLSDFDPKSVNTDPAAPRKLVLGRTAFPMDMRYAEPSGTNQEFIDYVFAVAAHKSDAIEQIYIEDDLAWTSGGGAQGKFAGYLTVEVILEAGSGAYHTVNAGTIWNSTTRLTGCTTMKLRVKRSDNSKSSQSPFGSGLSGRIATIGRGMPVYDPAQDSTVAGGSGSQRAATNSTWAYTAGTTRGNNPALQLLSYLLGWKIGGVVSVGVGLPSNVLDLPSFATAAALCDESVALADGGSQRRYEAGRAFSDADDPMAVIAVLLAAMNGELVDDGGRIALRLAVNDLSPTVTLTDDDFVSGYEWRPAAPIDQQFTVVRGRYSQPDAPSLFGAVDYPEVSIPRTSLAPRALTLELSAVQDQRRAERIAKQAAVRNLYQGNFTVTLGARGWLLRRNMVVAVTSYVRGWTAKLFRVRSLTFNADATVDVVLREENAAIYAWSASESAVVTPVAPVVFDSRAAASWLMADIAAGSTVGAVAGTNLFDSGGRTLTDGEISNTSQRVAVRQWAFNNQSLNGWSGVAQSGSAPTVTAGSQFVTYTANATDTSFMSPDMLDVDGRVGRYLRLILSATAPLSALMRNVEVYFSTNAYAPIDGTRSKNGDWIPANHPTNGTPFEVLLDMHSLTAGGNAWRDEIVRRVRIDFDGTIPETIRIHEISMVYLGTATVGAPSGTPVGAYADSASIAPAVASAATTAQWPNVTGTGRPADNATVGAPAGTPVGSMSADDVSGRVSAAIDSSGLIINGRTLADRISGQLQDAQIAALAAGKISGQLTDAQLASIAAAKVSGQLSDTQLASIAAAKVTGQMSDAQLLAISAAKVTGQITSTQITDGAILTAKLAAGSVTTATLAADAITADKIAAGAVTASEIAAGAVTTAKLAAGAVTANEIAAASITASQIATATITSANIAAGTIAASNIAAGSITASQIAAGTITSANIAAGTIAASNIAAGTITGNLLQANTITSTQLATSNLITASAQIADGVITNAKISNLSADKIDAGTINTNRLNLNGLQLTNSGGQLSIANAGVDTSQVALQAITRVVAVNVATGINPTSNTWTTYSDVTLTVASGTSVRVDASMRVIMDVSSTFGASAELRIIRTVGGTDTTIYNTFLNTLTAANMTVEVGGNYGTATISYTMATTPSVIWVDIHGTSGSVKYTIQVRQNGGVTFENLTLVGTEIRR